MYYCDSNSDTHVFSLSTHRFPIPSEEARKDQSIGRSHWMCESLYNVCVQCIDTIPYVSIYSALALLDV